MKTEDQIADLTAPVPSEAPKTALPAWPAAVTPVEGLNGVWEYRGVKLTKDEMRGGYMTYSCIVDKKPPHGTMRFTAAGIRGLIRLIDYHLDTGGKVR